MTLYFIRHGATEGNRAFRYIGSTDEPLSPEGVEQAREIICNTEFSRVFVSPMIRAGQTAAVIFPRAEQEVIEDFREMDFGHFENRSADEMTDDPEYREWVDGGCVGSCPGGESRQEFSGRVCEAFSGLAGRLYSEGAEAAALVVHGGTIMSILERFAVPAKDYFEYRVKNCGIYRCSLTGVDPPVLERPEQTETIG